ncbi:XRE family transcriptional regulator [Lachnospiraceae bacterium]|nr:XRE family transcriptional regulator [Lachnospiraceae bacterium]
MIDVLEQIVYYRKQKGWTEYQLAEESGLTQSTISSWYRKNMIPSIPSLEKVCNAFGITLSQFFAAEGDNFSLTERQKELLQEAGHLTDAQQSALISFFKTL